MRAKVESKLSDARERRLHERYIRERQYTSKAEQSYSDILRQVVPLQRIYFPALSQVCELSCFRELLNPDRVVQHTEWVVAAGQLLESLSEWMSLHRDKYIGLLPFDSHGAHDKAMEVKLLSDPSTEEWRQAGTHDFAGKLELATSVFRHPDTNTIYIGRDTCHAWKTKEEPEYSERGAQAVRSLLQELHLDPETTTASTLEHLDRRFVCACCPEDLQRFHHSWRSCVSSRFLNSVMNLSGILDIGFSFCRLFGDRPSMPSMAGGESRRGGPERLALRPLLPAPVRNVALQSLFRLSLAWSVSIPCRDFEARDARACISTCSDSVGFF